MRVWCVRGCWMVLLCATSTNPLAAQTLGLGQHLPTGSIAPVHEQVVPRVALPPPEHMLGLIRTTIIAIDQANKTGNYTVLRDLSAPDFSKANDASRLALIFQVLREKGIDFSPLLQIPPEVSETPVIDGQGLLRLAGFFPTEPLRVNFDLSFQAFEGRWRPYTISVYLAHVEAQQLAPVLTRKISPPPVTPLAAKAKQAAPLPNMR